MGDRGAAAPAHPRRVAASAPAKITAEVVATGTIAATLVGTVDGANLIRLRASREEAPASSSIGARLEATFPPVVVEVPQAEVPQAEAPKASTLRASDRWVGSRTPWPTRAVEATKPSSRIVKTLSPLAIACPQPSKATWARLYTRVASM